MADICSFTNGAGLDINLNDVTSYITLDFAGVGIPDPAHDVRDLPLRDGALYVATRLPARVITLYMIVRGTSYAGRRAAESQLLAAISPRSGLGTLTMARSGGTARSIPAIFSGGAQWGPDTKIGPTARRVALTFLCPGTYFVATDPSTVIFAAPSGSAPKVNTEYGFLYHGNAPTSPVITITGPATSPYLKCVGPDNVTRYVGLTYTLAGGSSIEFDFSTGVKSITLDPSSTALDIRGTLGQVSGNNPEFFEFLPGLNKLTITDQAGSPTAIATLTFYERFESL